MSVGEREIEGEVEREIERFVQVKATDRLTESVKQREWRIEKETD